MWGRGRRGRIVVCALTVAGIIPARQALGHPGNSTSSGWLSRNDGADCTWGSNQFAHNVQQNYTGSYYAYKVLGFDVVDCADSWNRPAGNIRGKSSWSVGGVKCSGSADVYNDVTATALQLDFFYNVARSCGTKYVTMQSTHHVYNGEWNGGPINPAGHHDYQRKW